MDGIIIGTVIIKWFLWCLISVGIANLTVKEWNSENVMNRLIEESQKENRSRRNA